MLIYGIAKDQEGNEYYMVKNLSLIHIFGSLEMLNTIAAQDIEEVTVLKDASETAQYGSRAIRDAF